MHKCLRKHKELTLRPHAFTDTTGIAEPSAMPNISTSPSSLSFISSTSGRWVVAVRFLFSRGTYIITHTPTPRPVHIFNMIMYSIRSARHSPQITFESNCFYASQWHANQDDVAVSPPTTQRLHRFCDWCCEWGCCHRHQHGCTVKLLQH
nr:hypothetical protein EHBNLLAN_00004 [Methanosarcinales archaeon ANME-2c ERB4]